MNSSRQCDSAVAFGLSLATVPFLLSLFIANSLKENLKDVGEAVEEIFRGDRLPLLNFPEDIKPS